MARKTANDYRKEHQDLLEKTQALEARIKNRLIGLLKKHPDAIIGHKADKERTPITTSAINSKCYLNSLSVETTLTYIGIIEKYLASLSKVTQGELFNEK